MTTEQRDKKCLGRAGPPEALEITRAEGCHVISARGRKYLDFTSGWCVGNFGWGDPALEEELKRFQGPAYVPPAYLYRPWIELAELLIRMAPGAFAKVFRATGGSEAVDLALQAAMWHTKRGKFLSFEGSYHGDSIAALSVGATKGQEDLPNFLRGCGKIAPPLDEKALERIERRLKPRDVAAVILEPVAIHLGVRRPQAAVMRELQRLCRHHGTLLIFDEVACGLGRTGKLFATEHFEGVEPDILCLAKSLSGGHAPIGSALMMEEVARSMEQHGSFYSTFGWHPYSVHTALTTLRHVWKRRARLLDGVAAMSDWFRESLAGLPFPGLRETRIAGLAIALDLKDAQTVSKLAKNCRADGLLLADTGENTLLLLPPLCIDRPTAERGLDILARACRKLS